MHMRLGCLQCKAYIQVSRVRNSHLPPATQLPVLVQKGGLYRLCYNRVFLLFP